MRRALVMIALAAGCAGSDEPPPMIFPQGGKPLPDAGPTRACGIVPGSACEGEGEIVRCLCGTFEEQIGRFVCCHNGIVVALDCQQAQYSRGCDGKPATAADAGTN